MEYEGDTYLTRKSYTVYFLGYITYNEKSPIGYIHRYEVFHTHNFFPFYFLNLVNLCFDIDNICNTF